MKMEETNYGADGNNNCGTFCLTKQQQKYVLLFKIHVQICVIHEKICAFCLYHWISALCFFFLSGEG
jgi:hypothetical protein